MTEELAKRTQHTDLLNRVTGEVVPLDAPTDKLAEFIQNVRDVEAELRWMKGHANDEILRRMDNELEHTVVAGPWKVSGPRTAPVSWDGERLASVVQDLVAEGVITDRAAEKVVQSVVEFKVAGREAKGLIASLRSAGREQDARAVEGCAAPSHHPRRVSISRRDA